MTSLLYGRECTAASTARFIFAAATSFIARVIFWVFLTDAIRVLIAFSEGMDASAAPRRGAGYERWIRR